MRNYTAVFPGNTFFTACIIECLALDNNHVFLISNNRNLNTALKVACRPGDLTFLNPEDIESLEKNLKFCKAVLDLSHYPLDAFGKNGKSVNFIAKMSHKCGVPKLIKLSFITSDRRKNSLSAKRILANDAATEEGFPETTFILSDIIVWRNMLTSDIENLIETAKESTIEGVTIFKPVYAGDLAKLFAKSIDDTPSPNKHYIAIGARAYTFEALKNLFSTIVEKRYLLRPGCFFNLWQSLISKSLIKIFGTVNLEEIGLRERNRRAQTSSIQNDMERRGVKITRIETVL